MFSIPRGEARQDRGREIENGSSFFSDMVFGFFRYTISEMKSDIFQKRLSEKDLFSLVILVLFQKDPLQTRIMNRFEFCC